MPVRRRGLREGGRKGAQRSGKKRGSERGAGSAEIKERKGGPKINQSR